MTASTAREVDQKVLDLFWQLRSEDEKKQTLAVKTLSHILFNSLKKSKDGEVPSEVQYCINRLIKGLAANSDAARRGFLRCFENVLNGTHSIPLNFFEENISKHIQVSGAQSKSEMTDTLRALILAHKAVLASGKVTDGEKVGEIVVKILEAGSQKAMLVPLALEAVTGVLEKIPLVVFKEAVWPALQPIICVQWEDETSEKLSLLFKCQEKFPKVISDKMIKKTLGSSELASEETYLHLAKILLHSESSSSSYPTDLFLYLNKTNKLGEFLPTLQDVLEVQGKQKSTVTYLNFLVLLLEKGDFNHVSLVVSASTCKILGEKTKENAKLVDRLTNLIQKKLSLPEVTDEAQASVAKAVIKAAKGEDNGSSVFGFLQVVLPSLRAEAVKKVCSLLKKIVEDSERKTKDRILALHQLTRAACHKALKTEPEFLEKTILKLVSMCFKNTRDMPRELTSVLKDQILKIVESPSANVDQWCSLLSNTLTAIDGTMPADYFKAEEAKKSWDSVLVRLEELNAVAEKDWCKQIFRVLYSHVAFILLQDPSIADEVIGDLDKCYEKSQKKKTKKRKSGVQDTEPDWVEVMTDMLLFLLGQNKAGLRNMCNVTWKLLVPHLNESALQSVLEVLKFTEEDGTTYRPPVSKKAKVDEDSDVSEESDLSETDEEEDAGEGGDTLVKLKMDLHKALGENAALTDQEDIDIDEMDQDTMDSVDRALAAAFEAHQAGKSNKKQTKHEEKSSLARMHLKTRALDLVEITISQTADYKMILMIIIPLAECFCEAARSSKQSQLLNRLKNALKSLRDWKPKDGAAEVVSDQLLDTLKQLVEVAVKNHTNISYVSEAMSHAFSCVMKLALQGEKTATETPKELTKASLQVLDLLTGVLEDFATSKSTVIPSHFIYKALDVPSQLRQILMKKLAEVSFNHPELGKQKRLALLAMVQNAVKNASLVTDSVETEESFVEDIIKLSIQNMGSVEFCKPEHGIIFDILNILYLKVKSVTRMDTVLEELKQAVVTYNATVSVSKVARPAFVKLMTHFGLKFDQKTSNLPKPVKPAKPIGPLKTNAEIQGEKRKKKREKLRKIREEQKSAKASKKGAVKEEENGEESETPKKKKASKKGAVKEEKMEEENGEESETPKKKKASKKGGVKKEKMEGETTAEVETPKKEMKAVESVKKTKKVQQNGHIGKTIENAEEPAAVKLSKIPIKVKQGKENVAESGKKNKKNKEEVEIVKSAKKVNGSALKRKSGEPSVDMSPKLKSPKVSRKKVQ